MASFLQVDNLIYYYGELALFDDISFHIEEGQKTALIARNGAGKTTLLRVLSGSEGANSGSIAYMKDIRVGMLAQEPVMNDELTVIDQLFATAGPVSTAIKEYELALESNDEKRLQKAIEDMDFNQAWDYETRVRQMLSVLKIHHFDQKVGTLSGGQRKRVALASVLISQPDLIILDEPTNHLDLDMIEWLEEYLSGPGITLLMVTHDRYFLDHICNRILELDERKLYSYTGNYSKYLEKREERIASLQAQTDKARNLMRTELDWIRRQPQARGTKAKYRVDAFEELKEVASYKRIDTKVKLSAGQARLGSKILEIKELNKSYGELCLLKDFSYIFSRGEKVGIVGNNGTGKSTFLNLITENISPDSGVIEIGETIVYGYYRQEEQVFDESKRVIDVVNDIAEVVTLSDGSHMGVSQFLNMFLFPFETQYNYVGKLSVGEKRRLYLCTVLMRNPNFLILDEPTNHLDILTLNVLEEYLSNFAGCLIVVSHDRFFMDKLVDHLFVFQGNGAIKDFPGNYSDYREYTLYKQQQENQSVAKPAAKQEKPKTESSTAKRKATYKEQKEYEQLTADIDSLETEKKQLEDDLSSGTLPTEKIIAASQRIAEIINLIDAKTERWLELSEFAG
jgi:ATP-binding cassette subfamily F protein uup